MRLVGAAGLWGSLGGWGEGCVCLCVLSLCLCVRVARTARPPYLAHAPTRRGRRTSKADAQERWLSKANVGLRNGDRVAEISHAPWAASAPPPAHRWVRPYLAESTISRPICEVKQPQA